LALAIIIVVIWQEAFVAAFIVWVRSELVMNFLDTVIEKTFPLLVLWDLRCRHVLLTCHLLVIIFELGRLL